MKSPKRYTRFFQVLGVAALLASLVVMSSCQCKVPGGSATETVTIGPI